MEYLKNKEIIVRDYEGGSDAITLSCSVPWGSVLGQNLLNMSKGVTIVVYADDEAVVA